MTDHPQQEMTFSRLYEDQLRVVELAMPTEPSPQLLGVARDCCLSLIERLEFVVRCETTGFVDGDVVEESDNESGWHELKIDTADKMRRACERLDDIDTALSALGYDPEKCGFDRPPLH